MWLHFTYPWSSFLASTRSFVKIVKEWLFLELCKKLYEVGGSRSISGPPPPSLHPSRTKISPSLPLNHLYSSCAFVVQGGVEVARQKRYGLRCNRCKKRRRRKIKIKPRCHHYEDFIWWTHHLRTSPVSHDSPLLSAPRSDCVSWRSQRAHITH